MLGNPALLRVSPLFPNYKDIRGRIASRDHPPKSLTFFSNETVRGTREPFSLKSSVRDFRIRKTNASLVFMKRADIVSQRTARRLSFSIYYPRRDHRLPAGMLLVVPAATFRKRCSINRTRLQLSPDRRRIVLTRLGSGRDKTELLARRRERRREEGRKVSRLGVKRARLLGPSVRTDERSSEHLLFRILVDRVGTEREA